MNAFGCKPLIMIAAMLPLLISCSGRSWVTTRGIYVGFINDSLAGLYLFDQKSKEVFMGSEQRYDVELRSYKMACLRQGKVEELANPLSVGNSDYVPEFAVIGDEIFLSNRGFGNVLSIKPGEAAASRIEGCCPGRISAWPDAGRYLLRIDTLNFSDSVEFKMWNRHDGMTTTIKPDSIFAFSGATWFDLLYQDGTFYGIYSQGGRHFLATKTKGGQDTKIFALPRLAEPGIPDTAKFSVFIPSGYQVMVVRYKNYLSSKAYSLPDVFKNQVEAKSIPFGWNVSHDLSMEAEIHGQTLFFKARGRDTLSVYDISRLVKK
jgi:hypothetical protein